LVFFVVVVLALASALLFLGLNFSHKFLVGHLANLGFGVLLEFLVLQAFLLQLNDLCVNLVSAGWRGHSEQAKLLDSFHCGLESGLHCDSPNLLLLAALLASDNSKRLSLAFVRSLHLSIGNVLGDEFSGMLILEALINLLSNHLVLGIHQSVLYLHLVQVSDQVLDGLLFSLEGNLAVSELGALLSQQLLLALLALQNVLLAIGQELHLANLSVLKVEF
jgi:hypothetical protein